MPSRLFIHGLESGNQGTKARFFRERFPEMLTPLFEGSLPERMQHLADILAGRRSVTIVGSSFGGMMAALFAIQAPDRVQRLILLAPALNLLEHSGCEIRPINIPTRIYHGTQDDIIPIHQVEPLSRRIFQDLFFHRVLDDHFLHATFKRLDWQALLG